VTGRLIFIHPPVSFAYTGDSETAQAIAEHLCADGCNSATIELRGHTPPQNVLREAARLLGEPVASQNGIIHILSTPDPEDYYFLSASEVGSNKKAPKVARAARALGGAA